MLPGTLKDPEKRHVPTGPIAFFSLACSEERGAVAGKFLLDQEATASESAELGNGAGRGWGCFGIKLRKLRFATCWHVDGCASTKVVGTRLLHPMNDKKSL